MSSCWFLIHLCNRLRSMCTGHEFQPHLRQDILSAWRHDQTTLYTCRDPWNQQLGYNALIRRPCFIGSQRTNIQFWGKCTREGTPWCEKSLPWRLGVLQLRICSRDSDNQNPGTASLVTELHVIVIRQFSAWTVPHGYSAYAEQTSAERRGDRRVSTFGQDVGSLTRALRTPCFLPFIVSKMLDVLGHKPAHCSLNSR